MIDPNKSTRASRMVTPLWSSESKAVADQHEDSIRFMAEREGVKIGDIRRKDFGIIKACLLGSEEFPWEHGDSYVTEFYAEAV